MVNIKKATLMGLGISVLIVVFLAPIASSFPDGLEKVAEDLNFIDYARDNYYEIMPDYTVKGVNNSVLSTVLSGVLGILMTVSLSMILMLIIRKKQKACNE